jgi:hypothetical protein
MALGGINAGLNTNVPSGTSSAGLGDADLRSIKTTFQQVLDSEHHFPDTGGSGSGAHRLGSGRAFYGASSLLSSSDTDGRLYIDSTNSRLHHAGSSNTMVLGGQYVTFGHPVVRWVTGSSGATDASTSGITQRMVTEAGMWVMPSGSTTTSVILYNTFIKGVAVISQAPPVGSTSVTTQWPVLGSGVPLSGTSLLGVINRDTNGTIISATTYNFSYHVTGIVAL